MNTFSTPMSEEQIAEAFRLYNEKYNTQYSYSAQVSGVEEEIKDICQEIVQGIINEITDEVTQEIFPQVTDLKEEIQEKIQEDDGELKAAEITFKLTYAITDYTPKQIWMLKVLLGLSSEQILSELKKSKDKQAKWAQNIDKIVPPEIMEKRPDYLPKITDSVKQILIAK